MHYLYFLFHPSGWMNKVKEMRIATLHTHHLLIAPPLLLGYHCLVLRATSANNTDLCHGWRWRLMVLHRGRKWGSVYQLPHFLCPLPTYMKAHTVLFILFWLVLMTDRQTNVSSQLSYTNILALRQRRESVLNEETTICADQDHSHDLKITLDHSEFDLISWSQ